MPVAESNVLRKVASLTLDKLTDAKVARPRFVPEKLDFQLYEKFEGLFNCSCMYFTILKLNITTNCSSNYSTGYFQMFSFYNK